MKKRKSDDSLVSTAVEFAQKVDNLKSRLTFEDVRDATNGFSYLLGTRGFGNVYRGCLNGREVDVKKLKINSSQGDREFITEVDTINSIHHRHLVSLLGMLLNGSSSYLSNYL